MYRYLFICTISVLIFTGAGCPWKIGLSPGTLEVDAFSIFPTSLYMVHPVGQRGCPDPFAQAVKITAPEGSSYQVNQETIPSFITVKNPEGTFTTNSAALKLDFNCNITDRSPHDEKGEIEILGFDAEGKQIGNPKLEVTVKIK